MGRTVTLPVAEVIAGVVRSTLELRALSISASLTSHPCRSSGNNMYLVERLPVGLSARSSQEPSIQIAILLVYQRTGMWHAESSFKGTNQASSERPPNTERLAKYPYQTIFTVDLTKTSSFPHRNRPHTPNHKTRYQDLSPITSCS
jgi:hypothetical protein